MVKDVSSFPSLAGDLRVNAGRERQWHGLLVYWLFKHEGLSQRTLLEQHPERDDRI